VNKKIWERGKSRQNLPALSVRTSLSA